MKKSIFAGIGLGLLTGTIIGLSIAEVTGIVLGALTSLLAAFFGLRSNKEGATGNQILIGTFSITCLLAVFLGLYIRTHNLLAPSLASEIKAYQDAAFDRSEIKQIILFKTLGLVPSGFSFSKEGKESGMATSTVLMAGESKALHLCAAVDEKSSLHDIKAAFDVTDAKCQEIEQRLSVAIRDTTELRNTLLFFRTLICEPQK